MALNTFGGSPSDVLTNSAGDVVARYTGGANAGQPIRLTVWTSQDRSTQVTTLYAMDGVTALPGYVTPVTSLASANYGRVMFRASNAHSALWLWDGNPASDPWLVWARETPGNIGQALAKATEAAGSAAQAQSAAEDAQVQAEAAIGAAATAAESALSTLGSKLPLSAAAGGVARDGVTDDSDALQSVLNGGNVDLYLPAGQYLIQATLRVYANTTITMHPDAVILNDSMTAEYALTNGQVGNTTFATGYAGAGNITVRGGTIDNGPRRARGLATEAIGFAHCEDILIEGVTFLHNRASHFVELNSTRHGVIRGCTFHDMDPAGSNDRECINIDAATASGFPGFGTYDNTPCEDILIEDCTFDTVQYGVGTHSATGGHRDIKVLNNRFKNLTVDPTWGAPVHGRGWLSGRVSGNYINGAVNQAVHLQDCYDVVVDDNEIIDIGLQGDAIHSAVFINGGARCTAGPNRVSYTGAVRYHRPYDVQAGSGHRVYEAGATPGPNGLTENTAQGTCINDTFSLLLADDTVAVLVIPGSEAQGLVAIGGHSTASHSPRGLYWVRGTATPVVQAVAAITAANVTLTTGPLAGTTGTDGNITISAHTDGKLYVENRSGLARVIDVRFLNA